MVEESTAASHTLASEAEELSRMMSQFRVGAQSAGAGRASAKRRPPASNPVHAAQAKVTAFAGGRGAAVALAASAPADDGWTEF